MNTEVFIKQLKDLIADYKKSLVRNYTEVHDKQSMVSRSIAAIHRITGTSSTYSLEVDRVLKLQPYLHEHTPQIIGIVKALLDDLEAGYLQSLAEIVHAEVFADFIEMATHLLDNGYKDAAAVITGSTLESHLKKLALKGRLPIESPDGKPLKAERLNQDLTGQKTYTVLYQKSITAWLDLRNKAAHGNYGEYSLDQVRLMIAGVQDFMTRYQA